MTDINPVSNSGQSYGGSSSKSNPQNTKIKESLFTQLDKNHDHVISDEELIEAGYTGKDLNGLSEALFFAERTVNKWFIMDKNQNGTCDNVEMKMWEFHNNDENQKNGDLTSEEFAKKNKITFLKADVGMDFENWCKDWVENENPMNGIKAIVKERYGKDLNDEETQLLYDAMKNQANRWLFKDKALYNRLNLSAYTRLATTDQAVSCCGGDISKPPIGEQPRLDANGEIAESDSCEIIFASLDEEGGINTAYQSKNRLAWGAFKTVSDVEAAKMTPEEYAKYQKDWQEVRNMKAADFRDLQKPENKEALEKFETNSNMTVSQIVDFIDIVESTTGKDFDGNDWSLDTLTYHRDIMTKLNGTYGDEAILEGKTRADVPPEKQEWLKYLEEHGLLLKQFKE